MKTAKKTITIKRRGRPPKNEVVVKAAPKKRGRPRKTEDKPTTQSSLKFMLRIAEADVLRLNNALDHARTEIANLKHKEIGYKALISYFEHQLGLKGTQ